MNRSIIFLFTLLFVLVSGPIAHADNQDSQPQSQDQTAPKPKKKKAKKKKKPAVQDQSKAPAAAPDTAPAAPAASSAPVMPQPMPQAVGTGNSSAAATEDAAAAAEEHNNNREKTLEGSKSPFSGQFNVTYSGSSIDHPFSQLAPNPGNDVPAPLVTLAGSVSARYRIDKKTTAGLGLGLTGQSPFQNSHWTLADPSADIARSFKMGAINNRADFSVTLWTNNEYNNGLGYREGFSILDEAFYEWSFGLTTGIAFEIDANLFSSQSQYSAALVGSNQTGWDIYPEPYFEYQLSKRVNLRSVVGIGWNHTRDLSGNFALRGPKVYETFGVGVAAAEWCFLYGYLKAYPYSGILGVKTTSVGLNAIINLF